MRLRKVKLASASGVVGGAMVLGKQCRGVLLILIRVGQGRTTLAICACGRLFGHVFSRLSFLSSFSFSLVDGPV